MSDVIMPALGMAQDTGKLVQWLKQPGDAVAVGDVLFEVETDKSVMEVEAQAGGFLAQVSAGDGDDVPVGQVIAVIAASADEAGTAPAPKAAPTPEPAPEVAREEAVKDDGATEPEANPAARRSRAGRSSPAADGRILASPKARRLARAEGLDLGDLAQAGHPQPYHVSDLAVLRDLPKDGGQTVVMAAMKQITARTPRQGVRDFIDWMQTDGAITVTPAAMVASFAAGAFRAAMEMGTVILRIAPPEGAATTLRNPDFHRLSAPPVETDDDPHLVVHDLSDSVLTSLRLGDPGQPTLSIGADGDSYVLTFEFGADQMEDAQAIAFVTGLARHLADPLHHLV